MDFNELILARQSCRSYDESRAVEKEKLDAILEAARLAPSACNAQPYHLTVCTQQAAKAVAQATQGMGMNKFASQAPVMIVVSEAAYNPTAAAGSKLKKNDYRSIDIGIVTAYITAQATALGLSTCILGWFDDKQIRSICSLNTPVRLVVSLGYASAEDKLREKKRKDITQLAGFISEI